jgi:predicted nucleic acid-binding Zn ribbon protein
MSDDPLQVCPKCEGTLTKVIYPTGLIFKGSGFYSTDYKTPEKTSGNGSSPGTDKPETKADPKPESKPESSD